MWRRLQRALLHSFHNTISQWLFPKFFAVADNELVHGEGGLLPVAGYVVIGAALFLWMRWRGPSWQALWRSALQPAAPLAAHAGR